MRYKTSEDLDKAIKAAAKASPMDTGRAYAGFFFHRLLCRVFSDPDPRFLLKGGLGMKFCTGKLGVGSHSRKGVVESRATQRAVSCVASPAR